MREPRSRLSLPAKGDGLSAFQLMELAMPELNKAQPELDLLFAFASTIGAALAMGLPMAVLIIWICA